MTTTPATAPLPPLLITPWPDPVTDDVGFDPRSTYAELFWLPLLGPTSTWLMRRLAAEFDRQPDGFSIEVADLARSIGIGTRGGLRGPFHRALQRCERFALIARSDHDIHLVRRRLPVLSRAQVARLPRGLQAAHRRWQEERRSAQPPDVAQARRLARSLLDVGASAHEVESQLRRWAIDDRTARQALIALGER